MTRNVKQRDMQLKTLVPNSLLIDEQDGVYNVLLGEAITMASDKYFGTLTCGEDGKRTLRLNARYQARDFEFASVAEAEKWLIAVWRSNGGLI